MLTSKYITPVMYVDLCGKDPITILLIFIYSEINERKGTV